IYRIHDGIVEQVTKDHTFVQRLVDLGRITEEEALIHPRRSVLMRVLGDIEENPEIDTEVFDAIPGERWLICSDGLSGVVPERVMNDLLLSKEPANEIADLLIGETLEHGAHDNVTVVLLDIQTTSSAADFVPQATFVGSAVNPVVFVESKGKSALRFLNPKLLQSLLLHEPADTEFEPESDEYLDYILSQTRTRIRWRLVRQAVMWLLIFGTIAGGLALGYNYTQTRFYVGEFEGKIAIYQGIRESLGPLKFSHLYSQTQFSVGDLSEFNKKLVEQTVPANDYVDALRILDTLVGSNE
ncbi:MAG: PP2C family protein-serine/threonine phosphatase, partial [Micrococcales bacterium]